MLRLKAFFYKLVSVRKCNKGNYNKALFYAQKAAKSYVKYKKKFNSMDIEQHLHHCAEKLIARHNIKITGSVCKDNVGILASTIYDVGGHTECLMRFSESFHSDYNLYLFLTNSNGDSRQEAKTKYAYLESILSIFELDCLEDHYDAKLLSLLDVILKSRIKILFVYMHMQDVVSCAVLAILKKHTDIKIVFFNHGDHLFSLGFEFSDLIIELRKQGQFVTQNYRKKFNTTTIPLQGTRKDKLTTYSKEEIRDKKKELGIGEEDFVSISGFSSYKVFKDKKNSYLMFIRDLLESEPQLKHVLVTEISQKETKILNKVFCGREKLLDRLIIIDRVVEFDLLLQVGDVFIDSFPLGSALSHIDVIKNKRPTIIKKNNKNELYTFYNYLYEGYEYAIDDIDEMLEKTLFLLRNKDEQQRIAVKCFQHYLNTYEFDAIKEKYKQLIERHSSLSDFYMPLPADYKCKISI